MKLFIKIFSVALLLAASACFSQTAGGVQSINGVGGGPFTFAGSGVSCTGFTCTFSGGGGGGLPTATAAGQMIVSTAAGTTYTVIGQKFVNQPGDTIASIEAECSSLCTYVVTVPQTITLAANHTLSSNVFVQFDAGGVWTVNGSGFTLSGIQVSSSSTLSQHFNLSGTGSVSLSIFNQMVPVEWFGAVSYATQAAAASGTDSTASFQAAINALTYGQIQMQCAYYRTNSQLNITQSYKGIHGCVNGRGEPNTIVDTSATVNDAIISDTGTSPTSTSNFGVFDHFVMLRPTAPTGTTDSGLYLSFTGGVTVDNVASYDSHRDFYIHASPSFGTGGFFHTQGSWLLGETSGTWYVYYLDSSDGNAENSFMARDVAAGTGGSFPSGFTSYSWYEVGTALNDVNVYNFNAAATTYCMVLNFTGTGSGANTSDNHIISPTCDSMPTGGYGLQFNHVVAAGDGSVTVEDARISSSQAMTYGIDIESSSGIEIGGGTQCFGGFPCVFANASNGLVLSNILSNSSAAGAITLQATTGSTISDNALTGASQGILLKNNSNYNTITGNSFSNEVSQQIGINFQSGSTGNVFTGNSFDSTIPAAQQVEDTSGGTNGNANVGYPFTLYNTLATAYVQLHYRGTGHIYGEGVGNGSETTYGVANKWFLYDTTNSAMRAAIDPSGDLAVGYATPYPATFPEMFCVGSSCQFGVSSGGAVTGSAYSTLTNCSSSASPAVCGAAASGSVVIAASATSVVVDTTAVTANSQIQLTFDSSLGTKLGVTCNTTYAAPQITARTAATSFTVSTGSAPITNPACYSYTIVN